MKTQNKVVPLFQSEALIEIKHEQIGEDLIECVSARELYLKLGYGENQWSRWGNKNIIKNEWFIDKRDWEYSTDMSSIISAGQSAKDFFITVDEFFSEFSYMVKMPYPPDKTEDHDALFLYGYKFKDTDVKSLSKLEALRKLGESRKNKQEPQ